MAGHLLSSLLLAATAVAAQQAYNVPSDISSDGIPAAPPSYGTPAGLPSYGTPFEYHGCAVVDLNGFTDPIYVPNGLLTHETCQAVCQGTRIVAIFADSCRCGNDPNAFNATDSSVCDNPCLGDPNLGMCGSRCPINGDEISTIYIAIEAFPEDPGDRAELDPSVSPTATVEPSTVPVTTEDPRPSTIVPSDPPAQAQSTEPPPLPPPETMEEQPPRTSVTESEPEPDIVTQSLEPSSVPPDSDESVLSNIPESVEPTPSRVLKADADLRRFDGWSISVGLLLFLVMAI